MACWVYKPMRWPVGSRKPIPGIQDKGLGWRPDHDIIELTGALRRREGEEGTPATPASWGQLGKEQKKGDREVKDRKAAPSKSSRGAMRYQG